MGKDKTNNFLSEKYNKERKRACMDVCVCVRLRWHGPYAVRFPILLRTIYTYSPTLHFIKILNAHVQSFQQYLPNTYVTTKRIYSSIKT